MASPIHRNNNFAPPERNIQTVDSTGATTKTARTPSDKTCAPPERQGCSFWVPNQDQIPILGNPTWLLDLLATETRFPSWVHPMRLRQNQNHFIRWCSFYFLHAWLLPSSGFFPWSFLANVVGPILDSIPNTLLFCGHPFHIQNSEDHHFFLS